jgi:hypothetical protein
MTLSVVIRAEAFRKGFISAYDVSKKVPPFLVVEFRW